MNRFLFHNTPVNGVYVIDPIPLTDQRGYFERLFCKETFKAIGFTREIVHINHTLTQKKGSIRGLHFQYPPFAETKIIRCLQGVILDVAVDIRIESPTFLQWHGEILSADNRKMLHIPEGFAHGFQTLESDVELLYFHTESYHPEAESGLHFADPCLAIQWKLPCTEVSAKDQQYPFIDENFRGVTV